MVEGVETEVDDTETVETVEEVIDETLAAVQEAPIGAAAEEIPTASIPLRPKDHVQFTATTDITPPPHIGSYSMAIELNIVTVRVGQKYWIPKRVAEVLIDRKKGVIA